MDTKLHFYDYIEKDPKAFKDFDAFMTATRRSRPVFTEWFPVQERILDGYIPGNDQAGEGHADDVLIVDVGGGQGQNLERFKSKFPQAPGRLILEDRPRTVAEVNFSAAGMEAIPYDFFTPQPVKGTALPSRHRALPVPVENHEKSMADQHLGARTYYMSQIMHNWPDHLAASILRNTASAMKPGYSKLLINEYILPATACPLSPSYMDFHMMTGLAGCERTEKQFHELVASAGLKVIKFWYPEGIPDGIVEVMLDDEGSVASNGTGAGAIPMESNGIGMDSMAKESDGLGAGPPTKEINGTRWPDRAD